MLTFSAGISPGRASFKQSRDLRQLSLTKVPHRGIYARPSHVTGEAPVECVQPDPQTRQDRIDAVARGYDRDLWTFEESVRRLALIGIGRREAEELLVG